MFLLQVFNQFDLRVDHGNSLLVFKSSRYLFHLLMEVNVLCACLDHRELKFEDQ
ncbi:hypothetical protein D3C83_205450 [compost metagenome]